MSMIGFSYVWLLPAEDDDLVLCGQLVGWLLLLVGVHGVVELLGKVQHAPALDLGQLIPLSALGSRKLWRNFDPILLMNISVTRLKNRIFHKTFLTNVAGRNSFFNFLDG